MKRAVVTLFATAILTATALTGTVSTAEGAKPLSLRFALQYNEVDGSCEMFWGIDALTDPSGTSVTEFAIVESPTKLSGKELRASDPVVIPAEGGLVTYPTGRLVPIGEKSYIYVTPLVDGVPLTKAQSASFTCPAPPVV